MNRSFDTGKTAPSIGDARFTIAAGWRRLAPLGWLLVSAALLLAATPAISQETALEQVSFAELPGDRIRVTLTMSGPVPKPSTFSTDNPARVALDFGATTNRVKQRTTTVNLGPVRSVSAVEAMGRTRVVVNLVTPVPYETKIEGNRLQLTLNAAGSGMFVSESGAPRPSLDSIEGNTVKDIDFRRGPDGEGRVLITLTQPSTVIDTREQGEKVLVELRDSDIATKLVRRLDVTDFATPVQIVDTYPRGSDVVMEIMPNGEYEYIVYQTDELYTIEFKQLTKRQKEELKKKRFTYTGERLSLNFQDIEIRAVLQLLADFTDLNFVTSDTVSGSITLRLRNVPWDQALDIILKTKGLSSRSVGNVVLVAPTEEIAAREKIELESQKQIEELAPLRSEYIQVNYAQAASFALLLKSDDNRLMSERGNVSVDERTNTLLIQDTAAKLEDIRELVARLDVPVRQVLIESRIVIANDDFAKDLGVRFGFTGFGERDDYEYGLTGGVGDKTDPLPIDDTLEDIINPFNNASERLLTDLPAAAPSGAINFLVGRVGDYLLRLELSAMQLEGRGEVISTPRVITADQSEAIIKTGSEIPFTNEDDDGRPVTEFKEAVLELAVTPHITPDERIMMDLTVKKDQPDFANQTRDGVPIIRRELNTNVLVNNGDTIVLGGVFEQTRSENRESVPFFGELPYVGNLFRNDASENRKQELLIFVTPKVLSEDLRIN